MIIDMMIDIEILIIDNVVIMIITDIILDILIELDIFIIIFSSYMMVDIHIMIDYISEVILNQAIHIIENIDSIKTMIGIEQEAIEMTENLFMENIMKEMKIKITNKKIIEIHIEEMTIIIDKV